MRKGLKQALIYISTTSLTALIGSAIGMIVKYSLYKDDANNNLQTPAFIGLGIGAIAGLGIAVEISRRKELQRNERVENARELNKVNDLKQSDHNRKNQNEMEL